jgi:hypothetical protein
MMKQTPWNGVILGNLIVGQLLENIPVFYRSRGLLRCSQRPTLGPILSQLNPVHTLTPYFRLPIYNTVFESHPWRESHLDCFGNIVAVLCVTYALRRKKELSIEHIIDHIIRYARTCWSMLSDVTDLTLRLKKLRIHHMVRFMLKVRSMKEKFCQVIEYLRNSTVIKWFLSNWNEM